MGSPDEMMSALRILLGGPEEKLKQALNGLVRLLNKDHELAAGLMHVQGRLIHLSWQASEKGVTLGDDEYREVLCDLRWEIQQVLEAGHYRALNTMPTADMRDFIRDMAGHWMATCNSSCLANETPDVDGIHKHLNLEMDLRNS